MSAKIRWGVMGAAKIAREFLAPAIHMSASGRLAAVASNSPERAAALAAPYDARPITGYDALLADAEIDAVYIPLDNAAHVEWTRKALEAGKHVLCEKPIALKATEIDDLIALRDRTGKLAAEAFMVTHHPQWLRAREIIASGELGPLRQVDAAFSFFNADGQNIRNRPETGGGALRDIGVYPMVTTRFATGAEPKRIAGETEILNGIDATARARCEFDGFRLDFYVSMRMALRQEIVFHGEQGWLRVAAPFNAGVYGEETLEIRGPNGQRFERFPWTDQYELQIEAFNRAILDGAAFPCPLEFSHGNQAAIDAIYASSAQGGAWVDVA